MKFFLFLLIIIINFSCKNQDKNKLSQIEVQIKDNRSYLLSEISEKLTPVPLETNDSCLISNVSNIICTKEYFFIHSSSIFQFSRQGKFLRTIGRKGKGPREYLYVQSIAADEENSKLYLATGEKILVFDFNGNVIGIHNYPKFVDYMCYFDKYLWIITTQMAIKQSNGSYVNITKIYKLDHELICKDSITIRKVNLKASSGTIFPQARSISSYGNDLYIYSPVLLQEPIIRDTLYKINDNKLIPSLKIKFQEAAIVNNRKNIQIKSMFRTQNFLFSEYLFEKEQYLICYNIDKRKIMNMKEGFQDDILNTGNTNLMPLGTNTDLMCFVKYPYELKGLIKGVNENDNPILILIKLKEQ